MNKEKTSKRKHGQIGRDYRNHVFVESLGLMLTAMMVMVLVVLVVMVVVVCLYSTHATEQKRTEQNDAALLRALRKAGCVLWMSVWRFSVCWCTTARPAIGRTMGGALFMFSVHHGRTTHALEIAILGLFSPPPLSCRNELEKPP